MINNEFHIIGVAVSNYIDISSNKKFAKYRFSVELELLGSKLGRTNRVDIEVYGTNRAVVLSQSILGKQVAVNGYIDSLYNEKTDSAYTKLIAQNVMVLDNSADIEAVVDNNIEPPLPKDNPIVDDEQDTE